MDTTDRKARLLPQMQIAIVGGEKEMITLCSLPGCDEELVAKGRCKKHYIRSRKYVAKKKSIVGKTINYARMAGRLRGISQLPDDIKEAYGFSFNGSHK